MPDFRVGEGDIGGASTAFPEDPNFAGGEGIIADTIEVLAVDVEVQIATLSHDSDGIGLVKAILEVLSRIAEQALGLAALTIGIEKEVVGAILGDAEQVKPGVGRVGAEEDTAFVPLSNGHIHLESEIGEIRRLRVARLEVAFLRHIRVISAIGKGATASYGGIGGCERIPLAVCLCAQWVVQGRRPAHSVAQDALERVGGSGNLGVSSGLSIGGGLGYGCRGCRGRGRSLVVCLGRCRLLRLRGGGSLVMHHLGLIDAYIIDQSTAREQQ